MKIKEIVNRATKISIFNIKNRYFIKQEHSYNPKFKFLFNFYDFPNQLEKKR